MSQILQFRKKIKSTKNIAKITRAMEMVAASKIRKAQNLAEQSRFYAVEMHSLGSLLGKNVETSIYPLLAEGNNSGNDLVVLIGPEKGLCGNLNVNLTRGLMEIMESKVVNKIEFITVGKKAINIARHFEGEIIAEFSLGISQPTYEFVPGISRVIEERFTKGDIRRVIVVYNDFISTLEQKVRYRIILPLKLSGIESDVEEKSMQEVIFEPGVKDICESFLSLYIETQIYELILESFASEQSARMVAMKKATDNARDLISSLTLDYNKTRQNIITSEITDIGNSRNIVN